MPNKEPYANNLPTQTLTFSAVPESPIHLPLASISGCSVLPFSRNTLIAWKLFHLDLNTVSLPLSPSKPSNGQKYNHFNKTVVKFYIYHYYMWVPLCKNGYAPQSAPCVIVRVNVGAVCEVILHGLWVRWNYVSMATSAVLLGGRRRTQGGYRLGH